MFHLNDYVLQHLHCYYVMLLVSIYMENPWTHFRVLLWGIGTFIDRQTYRIQTCSFVPLLFLECFFKKNTLKYISQTSIVKEFFEYVFVNMLEEQSNTLRYANNIKIIMTSPLM